MDKNQDLLEIKGRLTAINDSMKRLQDEANGLTQKQARLLVDLGYPVVFQWNDRGEYLERYVLSTEDTNLLNQIRQVKGADLWELSHEYRGKLDLVAYRKNEGSGRTALVAIPFEDVCDYELVYLGWPKE